MVFLCSVIRNKSSVLQFCCKLYTFYSALDEINCRVMGLNCQLV